MATGSVGCVRTGYKFDIQRGGLTWGLAVCRERPPGRRPPKFATPGIISCSGVQLANKFSPPLLPASLTGQYCVARRRLSSVVVCNAAGGRAGRPPGARAVGRPKLHGGPVWLRSGGPGREIGRCVCLGNNLLMK